MELLVAKGGELENVSSNSTVDASFLTFAQRYNVPLVSFLSDIYGKVSKDVFTSLEEYGNYNDNLLVFEYEDLIKISKLFENMHYPDYFPMGLIELLDEIQESINEDTSLRVTAYLMY